MKRISSICIIMIMLVTSIMPAQNVWAAKKLRLNYNYFTMTGGMTIKLKAKTKKKVKWKSSNKKIAKVTSKGKVTGLRKGKCTITAKAGKYKGKCKIKVTSNAHGVQGEYTKTTLDVLSLKLDVNNIKYIGGLKPVMTNTKGTFKVEVKNNKKTVKWSSSNKNVATVSKGVITAVSEGKATIKAKIKTKTYKCTVYVTNYQNANKIAVQSNIYAMYKRLNDERIKHKIAPLKIVENLMSAAAVRAREIIPNEIIPLTAGIQVDSNFSHTRPDGTSYSTAIINAGLSRGLYMGENISYISDVPSSMSKFMNLCFEGFMNSTKHRANILDKDYTHVGIGYNEDIVYKNLNGVTCIATFWTQLFYTYP